MGRGHIVGLESHRAPVFQGFWSKWWGGRYLVVYFCGFLFAWLLDLQDTRDRATVQQYSRGPSKSLFDVSSVLGMRDVSRAKKEAEMSRPPLRQCDSVLSVYSRRV